VKNFLNNKDDSAASQELIVSAAEYAAHRGEIGKVIAAMNPDIAVLQEVENVAVLEDLVATELGGAYPAIAVVDGNDVRAIDVGVISKVPFTSIVSHKDDSFALQGTQGPEYRYARDCLEIHIDYNGREVVLLGVHFKAKDADPSSAIKRLAEAQHTRALADALFAEDGERAIAVLGDFNDTPGSPPHLAVLGEGDTQYKAAVDHVPAADRWTYNYQGKLELIDHQMSNARLAAMLDPASVVIRHEADAKAASDHAPMMATYLVK
jgi:endonuclease/exonuclease/phosphatase family metal-dependent hydrolase